jgi:hypothetical protein
VVGSAVDPASGNVGLIIDPDRSGRSGFVRVGGGPVAPDPSSRRTGFVRVGGGSVAPVGRPIGPFCNLYFDLPLPDGWWYECEDWS